MGSRNVKCRMLHWKISHDNRVNGLNDPWPILLYTWMIPCQDNLGRMEGEADTVKGMVFPKLKAVTIEKVELWLQLLHDSGLVFRYAINGSIYLQFPKDSVKKNQKIVGNMSEDSDFPEPPDADYAKWLEEKRACMNTYIRVRTCSPEGKGREGKGTEGKTAVKPPLPHQEIVDRFLQIKGVDQTDKAQVSAMYRRHSRSALALIQEAGGVAIALAAMTWVAETFDKKHLSWTLDTVAKHLPNFFREHKADDIAKKFNLTRNQVEQFEKLAAFHNQGVAGAA